jgi:serine/threonine-protein kinase
MGTVYKVRDLELDEIVALKTLRHEWIDAPGALERFKREVKLARRVTHRNVARTFDIGEHGREKFLTMEYVDGPSLSRAIEDRGAFPIPDALRVGVGIAEALEAAHAVDVVHRDLKPDNVLLASDGRIVVTDFGIAQLHRAGGGSETGVGQIVGTPAYMAPEQVEGAPIDARADLYALGLVLYEMLVGKRAFTGETPFAAAAARLVQPPPDPSRARSGLSEPLSALVRKLLARRRDDRPAGAGEVREALVALGKTATAPSVRPASPAVIPEVARSLALMPLRGVGPAEDAWIGEGLADDLQDALCMARGLRVKARGAPHEGEDAKAFGARMEVELVLDGNVRRSGDDVRLQLRLTSVEDGFQVWAHRFQCRIGDLLVVSDEAARAIAEAAGSAKPAAAPRAAADSGAIELYLRARQQGTRAFLDRAPPFALLEQARALAPSDPTILASYAILGARSTFRPGAPPELMPKAREAAERALEIAPGLADPWVAIAHVRHGSGDTPGAVRALKRAIANSPSCAEAHDLLGRVLAEADRIEEAQPHVDRALWLDGSLAFARVDRIRMYALLGDWPAVEREIDVLASHSTAHVVLISPRLSIWAGRQLIHGRLDAATTSFAEDVVGIFWRTFDEQVFHADDRATFDELLGAVPPVSRPARLFHQLRAELLSFVGDRDECLAAVEASVAAGLEDFGWIQRCPMLRPLHGEPRFEAARARVKVHADAVSQAWAER